MSTNREHLITELCVAEGFDPKSQINRAYMNGRIAETQRREAGRQAKAEGAVKQFTRGMITVAELHERLGEILAETV